MRKRKAKISPIERKPKNSHRVWWISKVTGFNDNGSWISANAAIDAVKDANRRFPDIVHTVETRFQRKSNSRVRKHFKSLFPAKNVNA